MCVCVIVFYFILETQQLVLISNSNQIFDLTKIQYKNFKYFVVVIVVVVTFSLLPAFKNTKEEKNRIIKIKKPKEQITTEPDSKII